MNTFELLFSDAAEMDSFLGGLEYRRLPVKAQATWACDSYDDLGRPIITFARRCYSEIGQPIRVRFTEQVKRPTR